MPPVPSEEVEKFARLAIHAVSQAYPNKPGHVITAADDLYTPEQRHPVFWGSFDWHSAVHSHWLLVRLLKQYPNNAVADDIRSYLNGVFTSEKLQGEADYFSAPSTRGFERMYGWAWLLCLASELDSFDDEDALRWRKNIQPLEDIIVARIFTYLPKLKYPIRTGVHPDTSFALSFTLDYARQVNNNDLVSLILSSARRYYSDDSNYPAAYEPSGEDFFSSALNEADLMRRVLSADEFPKWLDRFLPKLSTTGAINLLSPVAVSDITDGRLVHLAGLNLSRAWTLSGIASALDKHPQQQERLRAASDAHLTAGLAYVFSGNFMGEHWLASFAVYHMTGAGLN
ncbi:MAG: hypothetical protein ACI84O_000773 [Myxococcota bacterium]|jgi:hypothetical protein